MSEPARHLSLPLPIRERLRALVELRWSGREEPAPVDQLPETMPEGTVERLVSGGPFGWMIFARLDEVDGRIELEALEDDRMSGPGSYRVRDDGTKEELPSEWTTFITPKDCSPEELERLTQRFNAHNREVIERLRERGFPR